MQKLPKIQDFKAPEGYFDSLPDKIMEEIKPNRSIQWIKYAAAAAILVVSLGVWQFNSSDTQFETLSMDEEVNFFIESQYWTAEDVLAMVDNPEEILDQIIAEEMVYEIDMVDEKDQHWY
ncbi:hypothetical protein [Algoriphagus aquimarinus]|uniref:Uncharacterized protein n=1 Tax=Algoriphagus aquimarinus TaxID=237018 RepID=A0A1I0XRP0_9BACT|nr:hypothetical protein [Algoriphagus aquimarinus]SFB02868.1 hypothetical protein SAMN04489723_103312 [Algoriphagus aquimarinus]|tara:strand:- start:320065 stop:320424 length:360 start_codon:yes stop_codon:yes gene_type:complete